MPPLKLSTNPTTVFGGTTITGTAGVYYGDAVLGFSQPWTLTNYGVIQGAATGSYAGVYLEFGGKVTNAVNGSVVGSITGGTNGIYFGRAAGALVNQGTVSATGSTGHGAFFGAGGTVTNGASGATAGLISGGYEGIDFVGGPGTVTNFGRIEAKGGTNNVKTPGVLLNQGGAITNNGTIAGAYYSFAISGNTIQGGGVGIVSNNSATITNFGRIRGGAAGIYLGGSSGAATVTNFGTIEGGIGIDANNSTTSVTVVNHGAIKSDGVGIQLAAVVGGAGNDRVVVFPGAVFMGNVNGEGGSNTLELAAGASTGVISGLGESDLNGGFANFGVVSVDTGASWKFQSTQAATDTINLAAAQVEFSGTVQAGHTVAFTAGGATAKIDNVAQFAGKVTGFRPGDVLDFAGVTATSVSYSPGTLTLFNGGVGFAQIAFTTPIANPVFSVTADGAGGTSIHIKPPPVADFNADRMSDVLFQNSDGTPAIWEMNGLNVIPGGAGVPSLGNPGPSWHLISTGDFNGDGNSDLLFQNTDGTPGIWEMNGLNVLPGGAGVPSLGNPGSSWHLIPGL